MDSISADLREEIRAAIATRALKLDVCAGTSSLSMVDRIEALAVLAADTEELIRLRAAEAMLTQPLEAVLEALTRTDADPHLFAYCAGEFPRRPGVADTIAKNRSCPIDTLRPVVKYLSVSAVAELFEDLDRLSTSPELVAAMIDSTVLSVHQEEQLRELQDETLGPKDVFEEGLEEVIPDKGKRQTLLQKLSRLRVVERVQLALKGSRDERLLLIRDNCKVVQRAVLTSPQLTEREVEGFASMANLSEDTLRMIGRNRKYTKNYSIVRSLMNNPKTPLEISLHFVPHAKPADIKMLISNKNVPDAVRKLAHRLHRQRSAERDKPE
jgi:hypothetical protein